MIKISKNLKMNTNPILVCSFPKAGTYLVADLLERLGYENTHWHINEANWQDYSEASLDDMRHHPGKFTHDELAEDVVARLTTGQFAVSHLGVLNKKVTENVTILVIVRSIREALPSWCRWIYKTDRWSNCSEWKNEDDVSKRFSQFYKEYSKSLCGQYQAVYSWIEAGVGFIRYEDLMAVFNEASSQAVIYQLADFLEVDPEIVKNGLKSSLSTETKTSFSKETKSSDYDSYWSFSSSCRYYQSGLHKINSTLGYENYSRVAVFFYSSAHGVSMLVERVKRIIIRIVRKRDRV